MAFQDCIAAVRKAVGGKLTDAEAQALLDRVETLRKRVRSDGDLVRAEERIAELTAKEAEDLKIQAALARKHAAINARKRVELTTALDSLVKGGYTPVEALKVIMRGGNKRVQGVRASVAATQGAFEARYLGAILGKIVEERPHIEQLLSGKRMGLDRAEADAFGERVAREIWGQTDGQKSVTGDSDAAWLGRVLADTMELSRRDLNRRGANIGKLDDYGYLPQAHDGWRLLKVPEGDWVNAIIARLDMERSFPDLDEAGIREVLSEIYKTATTGQRDRVGARESGQVTGPANLAKGLSKERVLHFKSADDWIAYNKQFGFANPLASIFMHLRQASRIGGQMHVLGPNPEVMLKSLAAEQARLLRDNPSKKARGDAEALGKVEEWNDFKVMTGQTFAIGHAGWAQAGQVIRAVESTSKLGGVLLSSITDPVTLANNLRFQGKGFAQTYGKVFEGYLKGRGEGDSRQVSFLLGEGFDGLIDAISNPYAAEDAPAGKVAKAMTFFFRVSGLTWFTDTGRAVGARIMAADMGSHSGKNWAALPERYRNVLELQGFDAARWDVLRQAAWKGENGNTYVTPDRLRNLPDEAFDGLIADDVARAREALKVDDAKTPETIAKREAQLAKRVDAIRERVRGDLELMAHRFFADEVGFGIIEADARTRAVTTQGSRAGTVAGEALRFVMQFKSFPIAFTQRVLGRSVNSGPAFSTRGERIMRNSLHVGELIATLWVAGMMAQWGKDLAKGKTPKELWGDEGLNWKTLFAGLVQSGGLGIYGDFLFAENNRFGKGLAETLSGPAVGDFFTFGELLLGLRDVVVNGGEGADKVGDRAARFIEGLTPFANLFYIKAPLDLLILNSLRESLSPGYLRRQEQRAKKDFGQSFFLPRTL